VNIEKLEAQLAIDEGKRLAAYHDTEGILTVGIGHNCVAKPVAGVAKIGDRITEEQCRELFEADVSEAMAELDRRFPWWSGLDDVRQNILVNMCFNMGGKTLAGFVNTLRFIEQGEYSLAADGMLQSKWARQVGNRAKRLAQMMRTGEWLA